MPIIAENTTVLKHETLAPAHYRMTLTCPVAYQKAVPGQFVMLHASGTDRPLLPRPFSIHRLVAHEDGRPAMQILYRAVGRMTREMASARNGDAFRMVGPLGQGFSLPEIGCRTMVVAGGMGVAPMVFLVESMLKKGVDPKHCDVFLGARSREELLCRDELADTGVGLHVTTDDGSAGDHCLITHPFQTLAGVRPPDTIYACGPPAMLRCVAQAAQTLKVACQVSIETVMACGIGACLGCAVAGKSKDRYLHACADGPVFDAAALQWDSGTVLPQNDNKIQWGAPFRP